ncbi:ATP-binding cassette domain-containing protein [Acidipropionibacterium timonense]|uniref:ATP-binding cassette domain-containing protein n=1 Tax=Acidipropionibacterium timonense TaxID=2161818 RepID=UPI00102FF8F6|nr:hypothetical protein [Acidipropionibacterium timonense]
MLDLRAVRVIGPSATPVDLQLEAGVTLVVGVSGSGATSLLDAIAGRTERPVRGQVALDGRSLTGASETELDGVVSHVGRRPRRAGTVGSMASGADRHWIDDLDLGAHLATNRTMLEPDAAARAALLEACIDGAPVVVIDQVLAPMCAGSRRRAADVVRQLGDRGRIVVWAEHDLTIAVPVSDRIVDLSAGTTVSAPDTWTSPVLPPPPLARLADRLGVERSRTSTVSRSRELLTDLGMTCHLRPRRRKDPGEDLLTVEASRADSPAPGRSPCGRWRSWGSSAPPMRRPSGWHALCTGPAAPSRTIATWRTCSGSAPCPECARGSTVPAGSRAGPPADSSTSTDSPPPSSCPLRHRCARCPPGSHAPWSTCCRWRPASMPGTTRPRVCSSTRPTASTHGPAPTWRPSWAAQAGSSSSIATSSSSRRCATDCSSSRTSSSCRTRPLGKPG